MAPIVLLPAGMQQLAIVLPFRYMLSFPVEILAGQLEGSAIWTGLAIQAAWLLLALALCVGLWRAGLRRYSAVGG